MAKVAISRRTVTIPEGVTASFDDHVLTVNGPKGNLKRRLKAAGIDVSIQGDTVEISAELPRRREKALTGTYEAHVANMVKGVSKEFKYTMKIVYNHFPIKARVEGNTFVIENFLGERHQRSAPVLQDVKVQVKGDQVVVSGADREKVGQTVANIERATKVKRRDIRVFQDGIYLVSKEV